MFAAVAVGGLVVVGRSEHAVVGIDVSNFTLGKPFHYKPTLQVTRVMELLQGLKRASKLLTGCCGGICWCGWI